MSLKRDRVPPSGQTLVGAASDSAPRSRGYRSGLEREGELEWAESFCAANGYGPPKVLGMDAGLLCIGGCSTRR